MEGKARDLAQYIYYLPYEKVCFSYSDLIIFSFIICQVRELPPILNWKAWYNKCGKKKGKIFQEQK